jgi:DNA-binding transcriptional LysR family regulator
VKIHSTPPGKCESPLLPNRNRVGTPVIFPDASDFCDSVGLGVRLIERSTRRFRVTEIGQAFYERCRIVVMDAEQADAIVSEALGEPRGVVRCSCPLGLVEALSPAFVGFMKAFPKAKLQIVAVDRAVGLIDERIDIAVRVRAALDTDAALTMRTLGRSSRILVAAPTLAASCTVGDGAGLSDLPTLATTDQMGEIV